MTDMSLPPPASNEPAPDRRREIVVELERPRGRRRLGPSAKGSAFIRLLGSEVTFVCPGVLVAPLTLPPGLLAVAAVDRGRSGGVEHGRFAVLHRLGSGQVIPRAVGIEGWLWTSRHGSALPVLTGDDQPPNLALLFGKRLGEGVVNRCFSPEFVRALAERSPLGDPAILGLLATVASPSAAEDAFRLFGVLADATDREVPPAMRRHLPGDVPANPAIGGSDAQRADTSVAPPGG
jgi:hypothetical protein